MTVRIRHPAPAPARARLERALRPFDTAALALGCIIGFGCFVLPGDFLATAGPAGAAVGVALGAAAMIVIARSYGFMMSRLPLAGGPFAYVYHLAGPRHAGICGWLLVLGYLCIVPLNATALGVLGKYVAPGLFARGYLYSVAGFDIFLGEVLLASSAIIAMGWFHFRGVAAVGGLQSLMTIVLVGTVLLVGLGTLTAEEAALANLEPAIAPGRSAVGAVLAMLALSPWLYVGFDTLPQAAEELEFPPERGRRLMAWAITAGAAMYITVILATAAVQPWPETLAAGAEWATGMTVHKSIGLPGLFFLVAAVCMAILTGVNGFYLAGSRLLFSMGRAGVLPRWFAAVHGTHRTPHNAVLFTMLASLIAPWLGRQVILWIVDVSALGTAVGYLYTCLAAYAVARRADAGRTVASTAVPLVGALCSASFVILLTVPGMPAFMEPPSWLALAGWLILGGFLFLRRRGTGE